MKGLQVTTTFVEKGWAKAPGVRTDQLVWPPCTQSLCQDARCHSFTSIFIA